MTSNPSRKRLRIIAVPMMPMPMMPTRLAITCSRTFAADQLLRPPSSAKGRCGKMFQLDRAGSLLGLPQIILQLQLQPALRRAAEPLRQPNCHIGGNPRMTVEQRREGAAGDAEALDSSRHRQPQRIEA